MRSTKNPKKIEPLKKAFGEYFDQLELVEADLLDEISLMKACTGSTYIVHTASPFIIKLCGAVISRMYCMHPCFVVVFLFFLSQWI